METKVIIFDLYDTLIYYPKEYKKKPYLNFFKQIGLTKGEMSDWVNKIMTQNYESFESIKNEVRPDLEIDLSPYQNDLAEEIQSVRAFDDTHKVLERLSQKYRIFCLSNLATPYKQCYFEIGLDKWIEKPFFSCDMGMKKPDPEFFNSILSLCNSEGDNILPSQVVMIGDNPINDYEAALNVGMKAILKNKSLSEVTINL